MLHTALLLLALTVTPRSARGDDAIIDGIVDRMIDWVRSEGGYFSEKLIIRRMDPSEDASPFGVFAMADIEAGERILQVPQKCYIQIMDEAENTGDKDTVEESMKAYHSNLCKLSQKLLNEMKLGEESDFAPYIAYLETQKPGQLPATWSAGGRELLRELLTPGSDGVDWLNWHFKDTACISSTDPFEEHIVAVTKQRCYDVALIPLWDMINHDNAHINVESNSLYDEGGMKVFASTAIRAGEEIFASYDKCKDCSDTANYWGTPEILRDFGFVERYRQRWVFTDQEIWFEVWESDNGELKVQWDHDVYPDCNDEECEGSPNEEGVEFLRSELARIERVSLVDERLSKLPKHERSAIVEYKNAASTAMTLAVETAIQAMQEAQGLGENVEPRTVCVLKKCFTVNF